MSVGKLGGSWRDETQLEWEALALTLSLAPQTPTELAHTHPSDSNSFSHYSHSISPYSCRSAITGSSPDAFLDGIQIANAATPISTIGTATNVITSNPPLPYS